MTAEQSLKIYEILQLHFNNAEHAKEVVKAIEEVSETKAEEKTEKIAALVNKDIENLRQDMYRTFATKEDLANTRADIIKWMFIFWVGQVAATIAIFKLLH